MKFFKYSLLLSTSLLLNVQNSWSMDYDELKILKTLKQVSPFSPVKVYKRDDTEFTKWRRGDKPGAGLPSNPETFGQTHLITTLTDDDRCQISDKMCETILEGKDERIRVSETIKKPYRFHGQMIMEFENGKKYTGSGTLVGPNHVLTAGHNLYSHKQDEGWAKSVTFIPGRNEGDQPYGEIEGSILLSSKNWIASKVNTNDDYGMVILDTPIGNDTGWAGLFTSSNDNDLKGKEINVSGYPGDKGATELWTMKGSPLVNEETLEYEISTFAGQSGSGVWMKTDPKGTGEKGYYILGVHAYGGQDRNSATRITNDKFNTLIRWIEYYISPPGRGIVHLSTNTIYDGLLQKDALTDEERLYLKDKREKRKEDFNNEMTSLKTSHRAPMPLPNQNRPASIKKADDQLATMFTKGIIVSSTLTEAGNINLIRRQIVDAMEALEDINNFMRSVLIKNPQMEEQDKHRIRKFRRKYRALKDKKELEKSIASRNGIKSYFFSPANETRRFSDSRRYENLASDHNRIDQINQTKRQNIPLGHRFTAAANYVRGERILEEQDKLLGEAFALEEKWRSTQ